MAFFFSSRRRHTNCALVAGVQTVALPICYITLKHITRLSRYWQARADIKNVSDDRYFEDFGSSLTAASSRLLGSTGGLYGRGKYWDASLNAEIWNLTDPLPNRSSQPYTTLPRLTFDWAQPNLGNRDRTSGERGQ